jgi:hypothetical protein
MCLWWVVVAEVASEMVAKKVVVEEGRGVM